MTNNSDRQRENQELIERLMAEKHNRTSDKVVTNNSEEWDHDLAVMRDHAERIILTEFENRPPGDIVSKDFMERLILKTFLDGHAWRPSLEVRFKGGNLKWFNAVNWARGNLFRAELLMRAPDVPDSGYQLVPLHRGFDGLKFNGGLGGPRARPESQCCARRPRSA